MEYQGLSLGAKKRYTTEEAGNEGQLSKLHEGGMVREIRELAEVIMAHAANIAERTMARHFEYRPDLEAVYGKSERLVYIQDAGYNLEALAAAITLETPELFAEHITYLRTFLTSRNTPVDGLPMHLRCIGETLQSELGNEAWAQIERYLAAGERELG